MQGILNPNIEIRNSKQIQNSNFQMFKTINALRISSFYGFGHLDFGHSDFGHSDFVLRISNFLPHAPCSMPHALSHYYTVC